MCYGCWEGYGKPLLETPAVKAAVPLIKAVYDEDFVGGNLHVVLDDWNIEDEHVNEVALSDELSPAETACISAFKGMTMDERASALAIYEDFPSLYR